jgi:transposase
MVAAGQFLVLEERFGTVRGTVFPAGRGIQIQENSDMGKRKGSSGKRPRRQRSTGQSARASGETLTSWSVGALPIVNGILKQLKLEEFLRDALPAEDRRVKVPTASVLLVLLRNLLLSREPLYGIGEWATRHAPDLLGVTPEQVAALNDDRVGRCLDRLFDCDTASLALGVVGHAVRQFGVSLDELHNDSTTITFHGDYRSALEERSLRGRLRLAITWGHNKDHRPDLKQLLYILTIARDGGVPVQFRMASGNVVDDQTHQATWDLLCNLSGRRDFLYVADCKLATAENMAYLHHRGGRFVTVLPRTRAEDGAFRRSLAEGQSSWQPVWDKTDDEGLVVDRFSVWQPASQSAEGYRLLWYHSTRKAELDVLARSGRIERALKELAALREKLHSPRTRYRTEAKVAEAVEAILAECRAIDWITPQIAPRVEESYRQDRRGRPGKNARYRKQVRTRFDLNWTIDHAQLAVESLGDGVFPLITNVLDLSEREILWAYKRQPVIEKRFSQLKTDFAVAPVYLKEASRIQALLCVYFFTLLVEALLERELRQAMERAGIESLPMYPEGRPCRHPTTRRLIDLFDSVQRHTLLSATRRPRPFVTDLSRLQRRLLKLLGESGTKYGH